VVVQFSEINAFFAEIGRIDGETLRLQHQFDRLSRGGVVLNQQYAHAQSPSSPHRARSAGHERPPWNTPPHKLIRNATDDGYQNRIPTQAEEKVRDARPKAGLIASVCSCRIRFKNNFCPPMVPRPNSVCALGTVLSARPEGDALMINDTGKHEVKR
jgi:hypothetical protein